MTLYNYEIYDWGRMLSNVTFDEYLPVKVNFYLRKNMLLILDKASEIDKERERIISQYAKVDENGSFYFETEQDEQTANQEFIDLQKLTQDLDIVKIPLSSFENINLKTSQLDTLMKMIDEDK